MSPDETEAMVRSFWDEVSKGNLAVIDQFVAQDIVDHNPFPGQGPGAQGLRQVVETYRAAFPDAQVEIEDFTAEGDKLAFRTVMRATHKGDFMGIPATGKTICVSGIEMIRMAGGKMVERWGMSDNLGMMQQLGAVPEMAHYSGAGTTGGEPGSARHSREEREPAPPGGTDREMYETGGQRTAAPAGERGERSFAYEGGSDASSFAREFDNAWNSHDREKILAMFADDAVLTFVMDPVNRGEKKFPPDQVYRGKEEITGFVDQHLPGFHVESQGHEPAAGGLFWNSIFSDDFFRKAGVDKLQGMIEAIIEGGRVRRFTVTPSPESAAKLKAGIAPKT